MLVSLLAWGSFQKGTRKWLESHPRAGAGMELFAPEGKGQGDLELG